MIERAFTNSGEQFASLPLPGVPDAHTLGSDPDRHCLYVFCPGSSGALVFEEQA